MSGRPVRLAKGICGALAAWLLLAAAPAAAQLADIERLTFAAVERLPNGGPMRIRPTPPLRFESGRSVAGRTMYLTGSVSTDSLDSDRFRTTWIVSRFKVAGSAGTVEVALPDVILARLDSDALGRPLRVERPWQDFPVASPSPRLTAQDWGQVRNAALDQARNWLRLIEDYDDTPSFPAEVGVGMSVGARSLGQLFDVRMEALEAMVRGNRAGFWGDLPQGTMTPARRDLLAATVRTNLPTVYEADFRVRGTATYSGREQVLISGAFKKTPRTGPAIDGTMDMLVDPATGTVTLFRRRLVYRGTAQVDSLYLKVLLP